jgi:hypothetical protein
VHRPVSVRPYWPPVIGVSAVFVAVLVYADVDFAGRPFAVLWFMLVCPGMALVRLLRLSDAMTELAIAVALSLALDTIVAGTLIYVGSANFDVSFVVLLAITIVALAVDVARPSPPSTPAPQAR